MAYYWLKPVHGFIAIPQVPNNAAAFLPNFSQQQQHWIPPPNTLLYCLNPPAAYNVCSNGHKLMAQLGGANLRSKSNSSHILSGFEDCLVQKRYQVLKGLGSGAYGNVFKVKDKQENDKLYALKVIKTKQSMQSPIVTREIQMTLHINSIDPESKSLLVRMIRPFFYHQHFCIVYELLGPTIHNILAKNKKNGLQMQQVREISNQICQAVLFLHNNKMIHNDIKANNISFVSGGYHRDPETKRIVMDCTDIRLIDLGSTVFANEDHCSRLVATTRQYRSPEMGLRKRWCYKSDIWSIGCTIFEVYTGHILFPCINEIEKCYLIERIFQKRIPPALAMTSKLPCFDERGSLIYGPQVDHIVAKVKPLDSYKLRTEPFTRRLFDLLRRLLEIEAARRITAAQALEHPFLKDLNLPLKDV